MKNKCDVLNALDTLKKEFDEKEQNLRKQIENFDKCKISYTDIKSLNNAEEVLKNCKEHIQYYKNQYPTEKSWNNYVVETIIKAINFVDNDNKLWIPKLDGNESFFVPYWKKQSYGSFSYYYYYNWDATSGVGFLSEA